MYVCVPVYFTGDRDQMNGSIKIKIGIYVKTTFSLYFLFIAPKTHKNIIFSKTSDKPLSQYVEDTIISTMEKAKFY